MDLSSRIDRLNTDMTIFSWLSKVLDYPGEKLAESLVKGEIIDDLEGSEFDEVKKYIKSFAATDELLLDLQKDYTRLCFVSKPRLVPLFESVYKEGKLYQDSTFEIARLYDEAGLALGEEFKLPPDHITLELEFMSYLIYQEIEALKSDNKDNEELALRLQKETMINHLGDFGLSFADKLQQHSQTPFFKTLSDILKQTIEYELGHCAN
ncbi:MAG: molecular chaperone TorD family protein [Syntrophomonadaceae bacterium]|nr:molecular chaperone TorD family protein [Syntrophomonadaceae bacterium]MDD3889563.1 molecular chaperone TorD family protein [Syntrophomonadaceae bacterium]MDD4550133.1 molecular chaperone TorD family protein [Syntrophomonadaceae bacterium]